MKSEKEFEDDIQKKTAELLQKPIIAGILNALDQQLSSNLHYHSAQHTRDVLHEALLFALYDSLSPREIELLVVASCFHDTGFFERAFENEDIGAERAVSAMSTDGGYTQDEINLVAQMIRDTRVIQDATGARQIASTKLSGYLCDADLSNLGRTDFFDKLELVRKELKLEKAAFLKSTLSLIGAHDWYTPAARTLRETQKRQNIRDLKEWVLRS